MKYTITKNAAQCLICMDIIESKSVHDFITCSCGNLSVDGGHDYCKRSCMDMSKIKDLSTSIEGEK